MNKVLIIVIVIYLFLFNSIIINSNTNYVSANAYVLMDIDSNRVLKQKNMHQRKLIASTAKILTAIIAIEKGNLDDEITIIKSDLVEGSSIYLEVDEKITLRDLLYGLLLRSGNDAATAIKRHIDDEKFVSYMNEYAKKINMGNSTFENPTGLDSTSSNMSTAYDMGLLMSYCYKNEEFRKINQTITYKTTTNKKSYVWENKHKLIRKKDVYNGGKTGYTKQAGRTLITTASNDELNLVCVTLEDPNDWNSHQYLFKYGFEKYKKYLVYKSKIIKQDLQDYDYLLYEPFDIYLPLTKEEIKKIRAEIIVNKELLEFYIDDNLIYTSKLLRHYPDDLSNYLSIIL